MDPIMHRWLDRNISEAMALAAESDILKLRTIALADSLPPNRFVLRFECRTYVLKHNGEVGASDHAAVGICFPDHYLRQANAFEVFTFLGPKNFFHPNVRGGAICLGEHFLKPGTPLVELIFQAYSVVSFQRRAAHAPLNDAAAQWSRAHADLLPADPRPLKRRALDLSVMVNNLNPVTVNS